MISKSSMVSCFFFVALVFVTNQASPQDQNWTNFRGSKSNGLAETENIPLKMMAKSII